MIDHKADIIAALGAEDWTEERLAFLSKVVEYVSPKNFVENDTGGWTTVSNDQQSEFWNLCHELRNNHFAHDGECCHTLEVSITNRMYGYSFNQYIPYTIAAERRRSEPIQTMDERLAQSTENYRRYLHAMEFTSSKAADLARMFSHELKYFEEFKKEHSEYVAAKTFFDSDFALATDRLNVELLEAYVVFLTKAEKDELLTKIREKFHDAIVAHESVIDKLLDEGNLSESHAKILEGQRLWGLGIHGPQVRRRRELVREKEHANKAEGL